MTDETDDEPWSEWTDTLLGPMPRKKARNIQIAGHRPHPLQGIPDYPLLYYGR